MFWCVLCKIDQLLESIEEYDSLNLLIMMGENMNLRAGLFVWCVLIEQKVHNSCAQKVLNKLGNQPEKPIILKVDNAVQSTIKRVLNEHKVPCPRKISNST